MKKRKILGLIDSPFWISVVLLAICFLAYGLLIPTLGYYWDDWPYAWINHMFGPAGYPDYVALDRPYSAWVFMTLTAILGEGPMGYHISSLLLYWVCAVLYWWLITLVWPEHRREAFWAAMLFAVYPGFLGHPQGIIYNHHFAAMALYLFSLIGMVKVFRLRVKSSLKKTFILWYIPSVIALLVSQFTIEYFLGWEAVRLVLAWIVIKKFKSESTGRLSKPCSFLLPYWLVSMVFLIWRVFIFQFPTYQPFYSEPGFLLREWLLGIPLQIIDAALLAWGAAFPRLSSGAYGQVFWFSYLALWLFSAFSVFIFLYLFTIKPKKIGVIRSESASLFGKQALGVAIIGMLIAGLPFLLTELSLDIENRFLSRLSLPFIPWVALFVVVGFYFITKIRWKWINIIVAGLMAGLVGGSIARHFWNANVYRNDWIEVQRYIQQLVQRMPGIEPGTSLVVNDMPSLTLYQDDSLTAILNWTYAPEFAGTQMPYMMQYLSVRLGDEIPDLQPGLPIEHSYRSLNFSGSTDKIIVVYYQQHGCVRVLDESHLHQLPVDARKTMLDALPLSDLSLIHTDASSPAVPPLHLFDLETRDTWCMNFQKAELAAQVGDWEQVTALGDYAFQQLQHPNESTEMFVFLEAYLRVGRLEKALELSREMSNQSAGYLDDEICTSWQQVESDLGKYLGSEMLEMCEGN